MVSLIFPEERLQELRALFFPLIGETPQERLITGFNVYNEKHILPHKTKFNVHYLHAYLGKDDEHRLLFEKRLGNYGLVHLLSEINESVITREAAYLTKPYWEDPEDIRYFDTRGNEIPKSEVSDHIGTIIAESRQYDMLIGIETRKELQALMRFLRNHAYAEKIDSYGKRILDDEGNPIAAEKEDLLGEHTWEIPLITIACQEPQRVRGFKKIKRINLRHRKHRDQIDMAMLIRLLIDKKFYLFKMELDNNPEEYQFSYSVKSELANKLFVDEYINP